MEEPSTSGFERLMVAAFPKGGFKVSNSDDLNIETVNLAAFSTVEEAVAFIGRERRRT